MTAAVTEMEIQEIPVPSWHRQPSASTQRSSDGPVSLSLDAIRAGTHVYKLLGDSCT